MIPSHQTIFQEVAKAMTLAEANKDLASTDKPKFVINMILGLGLCAGLTAEEQILITEMIKCCIEGIIAISSNKVDISEINKELKVCWKMCC